MNKISSFIFLLTTFIITDIFSQKPPKDEVLFTYGSNKVMVSEFERGFLKNNDITKKKPNAAEVDEYLTLYKKFKLKVHEAFLMGMDTVPSFVSELNGYRRQLAKPFMTDSDVTEQLVKEAYERLKYEVHASHILIFTKPDDQPTDTLKAFNRMSEIRAEIVAGKMSFATAAYTYSEDPSAKDNKGDLGYFTAFQMIYPFENAAFNMNPGQVSSVFRTDFGYHILTVHDKRLSQGEMKARQIVVQLGPSPSNEDIEEGRKKINEIYKKLQAGEKFENLVSQYSEDYASARSKGEIKPFTMTSRLPVEIKTEAFKLKNDGDYTAPFQTQYGFFIVQRLSLTPTGTLDALRPTIINQISRDSRQYKNTQAVYNRLIKEYKLKENKSTYKAFESTLDSNFWLGSYSYKKSKLSSKPLFTLNKKVHLTVEDFGKYLEINNASSEIKSVKPLLERKYEDFKVTNVMSYHESNLDKKEPKFAAIYQEYKEGILLFNLTDKMVWSKSVEDTLGLQAFYEANAGKYQWTDRYQAVVYRCAGPAISDQVKKMVSEKIPSDTIVKHLNKESSLNVKAQSGRFEKGDNFYADFLFESGRKDDITVLSFEDPKAAGAFVVIAVQGFIKAGQKSLEEAKGPVTSDYQDHLEKQWVDELNKKHPIVVNNKAYETFKARIVN